MKNESSMLLLIRQNYSNLTKNEKSVADYVLTHSDTIDTMLIHDLAVASGVAKSAVVRFCKALGFSGYSEFKFNFSANTANSPDPTMLPVIKRGDTTKDIFNKIFTNSIDSLYRTIQQLDMDQTLRAVELLKNARHILLLGTGSSESVVVNAVYLFLQFGYQVASATSGVMMRTTAFNLKKEDIAIAISYSGHTHDTVSALHLAHRSGASTIAITSYDNSPLCKEADVVLYSPPGDVPYMTDHAIVCTRTSHICILDALIIALACSSYDDSILKLRARNAVVLPGIRD